MELIGSEEVLKPAHSDGGLDDSRDDHWKNRERECQQIEKRQCREDDIGAERLVLSSNENCERAAADEERSGTPGKVGNSCDSANLAQGV